MSHIPLKFDITWQQYPDGSLEEMFSNKADVLLFKVLYIIYCCFNL